jgi:hypothetical protein
MHLDQRVTFNKLAGAPQEDVELLIQRVYDSIDAVTE